MATTIIKLKTGSGAPSSLQLGEAAYDLVGKVLYIGTATGVDKVSDPVAIQTELAAIRTAYEAADVALGARVDATNTALTEAIASLSAATAAVDDKVTALDVAYKEADAALGLRIDAVAASVTSEAESIKTAYEAADAAVAQKAAQDLAAAQTAIDGTVAALDARVVTNTTDIADLKAKVAGSAVTLDGEQTITGVKTFSASPLVPTAENTVSDTTAASTSFVHNVTNASATTLLSHEVAVSGDDVSGTGNLANGIALSLKDVGVAGTYTKVTTDAKGRVVSGAALTADDIPDLTSAKITDFATAVQATTLDKFAKPVAAVDFNGQIVSGVASPVGDTDAVNKIYVDTVAQGLHAKAAVRAATTSNLLALEGLIVVDGVQMVAGDRVLVKNQADESQNGVFIVAEGAWARTPEHDAWNELVSAFVFVEEGTQNKDTGWVCTANKGGAIGDPVIWVQFSAAGTTQVGAGLIKHGNVIMALPGNGIDVSNGIAIASVYAGQASINTVGTITTGEWQGTAVAVAHGGTGLTSAVNGIVKGVDVDGRGLGSYVAAVDGTDYMSKVSTDAAIAAAIAVIDGGTY